MNSESGNSAIASAVEKFRLAIGHIHVLTDRSSVDEYERTTFTTTQSIPVVLLPGSTEDVCTIVRIANEHHIPLYPISRGRNWGLGSRVPVQTGNCVVDLGRMNRIIEFDERAATLTLEPGVTFEQVSQFLKERGSTLYLAATGGPPDSSVLANVLERGDGVGPIGDRARHFAGLEVVLPTGECLHTGLEQYPNSLTGKLVPNGLGPGLEGLFIQSNFGIVTRISVWLAKRAPKYQLALFTANTEEEVVAATTAIRELQQVGIVGDTAFSLWNVFRFLTAISYYPWRENGDALASPLQLLKQLPPSWKGMKWIGFVGIYSPSAMHATASRRMVRKALRSKVSKLIIINSFRARLARWLQKPLQRLTGIDVKKMLDALYFESVFLGQPSKIETSSTYWRKRGPVPSIVNPDRDRCGLHWICISLPFDGQHIAQTTTLVETVALKYGLEPLCMFFNMSQWYMKSFIPIMFDQDTEGQEAAARQCHDELFLALVNSGYSPVRLGIQSMELCGPSEPSYLRLLQRLKRLLDPNDICAPGRYDFRHRWLREVDDDVALAHHKAEVNMKPQ